jgi:hypothetical protein
VTQRGTPVFGWAKSTLRFGSFMRTGETSGLLVRTSTKVRKVCLWGEGVVVSLVEELL